MSEFFLFRGSRDYVLGADMLDFILSECGKDSDIKNFDFVVQRKTNKVCIIKKYGTNLSSKKPVAIFKSADENLQLFETNSEAEVRVSWDEQFMESSFVCMCNTKTVHVSFGKTGASFARSAVVAFKYLLNDCVSESKKSYVFVRLLMNDTLKSDYTITFTRMVAKKFFEGVIKSQGQSVGKIYFSEGS